MVAGDGASPPTRGAVIGVPVGVCACESKRAQSTCGYTIQSDDDDDDDAAD